MNQEFKFEYNTSFSTYARDYLKTNKPTDIVKMAKRNIEEQFEDTCVERWRRGILKNNLRKHV